MKNDKWTKTWEKWDNGEGWTLIVAWSGCEQGGMDCSGHTKAEAIANFKDCLCKLNILSEGLK